jgi:hypothetical protein
MRRPDQQVGQGDFHHITPAPINIIDEDEALGWHELWWRPVDRSS